MTKKQTAILAAIRPYGFAVALSGFTALGILAVRQDVHLATAAMLFLFTVFLAATKLGHGPGVTSAVLSVALLDYLFVPPHFSLVPVDVESGAILLVMSAVALMTAQLAAKLQRQAEIAESRERQAQRLYQLARDLAGSASAWQVQEALDAFLRQTGYRAILQLAAEDHPDPQPAEALEAIRSCRPVAGRLSGPALFLPLCARDKTRGMMIVAATSENGRDPQQEQALLETVASLVAIAAERLHYVELAQKTGLQINSERLRGSILSALSHDLRTPLTALVGLAESLALSAADAATQDTAQTIARQGRAMSELLANLLDMARLQGGKVVLRKEWQLFDDLIAASLRHFRLSRPAQAVKVFLAPDLPLVEFDAVLLERVVWNLLENAAKYAGGGEAIEVRAFAADGLACLSVCDHGPGFPPLRLKDAFELFRRGRPESAEPGVGLGLAIARAIVEAHGGSIEAANREEGGACITFRLPLGTPPTIEEEADLPGESL